MRIIYFKKDEKHVLGRAGENGATRITVDVAAWAAEYPSGTGAMLYKRPDGLVYPLTATLDGGLLCAVLTATDTAVSGVARVEAQWIEGAVVVKSATYEGSIASSLGEAGSVPAASPSWVDDMAALGVTVEADAAQVAADKATVATDKEAVAADKVAALAAKADAQAAQAGAEGAYAAAVIARDAAQAAKTDAQTAQAAATQSATEASGSATAAQQTAVQIVTDEAARVTAEQGRAGAEGTRQSAEQTRVSAEQGRVEAEAQRGTALATHEARTDNPHGVTAAQAGARRLASQEALNEITLTENTNAVVFDADAAGRGFALEGFTVTFRVPPTTDDVKVLMCDAYIAVDGYRNVCYFAGATYINYNTIGWLRVVRQGGNWVASGNKNSSGSPATLTTNGGASPGYPVASGITTISKVRLRFYDGSALPAGTVFRLYEEAL